MMTRSNWWYSSSIWIILLLLHSTWAKPNQPEGKTGTTRIHSPSNSIAEAENNSQQIFHLQGYKLVTNHSFPDAKVYVKYQRRLNNCCYLVCNPICRNGGCYSCNPPEPSTTSTSTETATSTATPSPTGTPSSSSTASVSYSSSPSSSVSVSSLASSSASPSTSPSASSSASPSASSSASPSGSVTVTSSSSFTFTPSGSVTSSSSGSISWAPTYSPSPTESSSSSASGSVSSTGSSTAIELSTQVIAATFSGITSSTGGSFVSTSGLPMVTVFGRNSSIQSTVSSNLSSGGNTSGTSSSPVSPPLSDKYILLIGIILGIVVVLILLRLWLIRHHTMKKTNVSSGGDKHTIRIDGTNKRHFKLSFLHPPTGGYSSTGYYVNSATTRNYATSTTTNTRNQSFEVVPAVNIKNVSKDSEYVISFTNNGKSSSSGSSSGSSGGSGSGRSSSSRPMNNRKSPFTKPSDTQGSFLRREDSFTFENSLYQYRNESIYSRKGKGQFSSSGRFSLQPTAVH